MGRPPVGEKSYRQFRKNDRFAISLHLAFFRSWSLIKDVQSLLMRTQRLGHSHLDLGWRNLSGRKGDRWVRQGLLRPPKRIW